MNKESGIHFYINVKNFNNVVLAEEDQFGSVNHAIHALDTLFRSVEQFGITRFKDSFVVEKITGARLHMYFRNQNADAIESLLTIASYAYQVSQRINRDIPKYNKLTDFRLQMGADVGDFFVFEFYHSDNNHENILSEVTTIGYPANFAAKLQAIAENSYLCISTNLYELSDYGVKNLFEKKTSPDIKKYGQPEYYTAHVNLFSKNYRIDEEMKAVAEYANKVNLTDMQFPVASKLLSFDDLSKGKGKTVTGIPLFADVRGFTTKFYADGSNLEEMAIETQSILETMYNVTTMHGGVHVQFQGDREMALFHDIGDDKCIEKAIIAGMRMIDKVSDMMLDIHLGAGADYGKMYAARIGARGEKDNILVGETVISSDRLEDEKAGRNEIAISPELYKELQEMNSKLVSFFKRRDGGEFVATIGYKEFLRESENDNNIRDTRNHSYNGAWHV